jgi:hypothetical protein
MRFKISLFNVNHNSQMDAIISIKEVYFILMKKIVVN